MIIADNCRYLVTQQKYQSVTEMLFFLKSFIVSQVSYEINSSSLSLISQLNKLHTCIYAIDSYLRLK